MRAVVRLAMPVLLLACLLAWQGDAAAADEVIDRVLAVAGGEEDRRVRMRIDATRVLRLSQQDIAAGKRQNRGAADKAGGDDGVVRRKRRYGGSQRRIISHNGSRGMNLTPGVIIELAAPAYLARRDPIHHAHRRQTHA